MGIDLLLEHFSEPLAGPPAPKVAPGAGKPKRVPHSHLHKLTDTALRSRLKGDSGSTASERAAAAALLQSRRDASDAQAQRSAAKADAAASSGDAKPAAGGKAEESRGSGVGVLLEAFTAPAPSSAAASPTAVANMPTVSTGGGHPRSSDGKFTFSSNSKQVTAAENAKTRTVGVGSKGALVEAVQRQIGAKADGVYGPQTKAAVERYQRQHGLQVDGVIGAQTLAALSGHTDAKSVKPGPIAAKAAAVKKVKAPAANVARYGGGTVV